jgi:hypothetical protein
MSLPFDEPIIDCSAAQDSANDFYCVDARLRVMSGQQPHARQGTAVLLQQL